MATMTVTILIWAGPVCARRRTTTLSLVILVVASLIHTTNAYLERLAPRPRDFTTLSTDRLHTVATLSDPSDIIDFHNPSSLLSKILIPRAPGSQNLTYCQSLFKQHFASLSTTLDVPSTSFLQDPNTHKSLSKIKTWTLEEHTFTNETPVGSYRFTNQIFTHDSTAPLKLVVAAHVDSKYFSSEPANQFVGATDSAAPVAIILEAVKALTPLLDAQLANKISQGNRMKEERVTLQVLLLDGEEAFEQWTSTDSIYGARALAEKWSQLQQPPTAYSQPSNVLSTIQAFILLDLLGAPNPSITNYFASTTWLFDTWLDAEKRLGEAGLLWKGQSGVLWSTSSQGQGKPFFTPHLQGRPMGWGRIEDDHIPFLRKGVPILHLIASPFPKVWHTLADDVTALDLPTIRAWTMITRVALAEYLGLNQYVDNIHKTQSHRELVSL